MRPRRDCRGASWQFLAALWFLAAPLYADVLVTGQGESLSGDLTRITDGILVFRTSLRGQMMVPMSEVKALTTDSPWVVTREDGAVHIGRFTGPGIAVAKGEGSTEELPLDFGAVSEATHLPAGIEAGSNGGEKPGWSGYSAVGARAFDAARDGIEPHAALGLRGVGPQGEIDLQVGFDLNGGEEFPSYFRGALEVAGGPSESWMPFVQGLLERDQNQALDVRTGLTVGMRYNFDLGGRGTLQGLAGVGATLDTWERSLLPGGRGWLDEGKRSERDLNAYLELRYSRALWGRGTWDSRMFLLPSVTDADHFRAGASSSLVYPVTTRLQLRLDMLMGYDHDPVFDTIDSVDTSLGASIQLDF